MLLCVSSAAVSSVQPSWCAHLVGGIGRQTTLSFREPPASRYQPSAAAEALCSAHLHRQCDTLDMRQPAAMQLLRLEMVISAWEAFITLQHVLHQCSSIQA